MTYTTIAACRGCGAPGLTELKDFGAHKINAFPRTREEADTLPTAPVRLVRCDRCTLVQLADTVDPSLLFTDYQYRSGQNETMVAALADVVRDVRERVDLKPGDFVLDVGANDGTLLRQYPSWVEIRGLEPAASVRWDDQRVALDYFPPRLVTWATTTHGLFKVITSIAQLYNSPDLPAYFETVAAWLHPDGVFVAQFQDLASMVEANGVDNLCHEHLTYFDLFSIKEMGARHGLALVDWSRNQTNGGSFRCVFKRTGEPAEVPAAVRTPSIHFFLQRANIRSVQTLAHLQRAKRTTGTPYGLGASTKFNTLQQMWRIGPEHLVAIGDRNPEKHGRFTVNGIPIVSEEAVREASPRTLLVCSWQFADAFAKREAALLAKGTRLIVPLPNLRLVGGVGADVLQEVA